MDARGLGDAMDGMFRLAMVGAAALVALTVAAPVALVAAGWWLYNHVSIH